MPERIQHRYHEEANRDATVIHTANFQKKRKRDNKQSNHWVPYRKLSAADRDAQQSNIAISTEIPVARIEEPVTSGKPGIQVGKQSNRVSEHEGHGRQKQSTNGAAGRKHPDVICGNPKDKARRLWEQRKELPVWSHSHTIRRGLHEKDVLLLVGETGSGKSTQVPQILIKESWCRSRVVSVPKSDGMYETAKVGGCIAVTEPRRVAAVSLARRVAEEMGSPLGSSSPASTVGYNVRFDNSTSPCTKIKFLTEGMLLQEMLRDPWLRTYSAVLVDEVHERGINVDLLMGFLKGMVNGSCEGRGGVPLKVGVMSATASVEGLLRFFEGDGSWTSTGDQKSNKTGKAENESDWSGISDSGDDETSKKARERRKNMSNSENVAVSDLKSNLTAEETGRKGQATALESSNTAVCYIEGRQYPVKVNYSSQPVQDFVDASLRTIFQIHYKEPLPGDILVFLTGQTAVESLESLVTEYAAGMGLEVPKLLVLPLFAALPQAAQQRVFHPAPSKTRKVILATNIAETSVTVSGVRFVIDCGKSKVKQFRTRIGLDSLLVKPISKSAAIQRKGRAGREAPGVCYRLYTEQDYLKLQSQNTPEILRCDLSQAVLTMKARGVNNVMNFPFLDRPPREAMEKALMQLFQLKALDDKGATSQIGLEMAKLPLTVTLARVLLAAAEPDLNCVSEVIDIISSLSVENVFLTLNSEEKEEKAQAARQELYRREGDHLTLLTTVRAYNTEQTDRKAWAEKHFVSHRAMQAVIVSSQSLPAA
ncbi:MAG: hypothetical protein L6R41_000838 [Letrouitia leprolyta]|nr:MAG: hypothetical protein L6R41_000838 [Letrouitia leprolyta]